ncbi:F-box protein [Mesorhizobium sp. M0761]|uniref:F-box protein n=1 Tax=Mesorhizobium sp. M0761 TaxID=2956994 RepID=UPI003335E2DA
MRGIEERGKAPISAFNSIERDIRDNSLIGTAAGVVEPGESSCSIVEQTRSEPQDQAFPPLSILDLPLDILVDIAERLSPMDLLRISVHKSRAACRRDDSRNVSRKADSGSGHLWQPCNGAPAASHPPRRRA